MSFDYREWYRANAYAINARRKRRYKKDPEYRERVLASVRKSKRKFRDERREGTEPILQRELENGEVVQVWKISDVAKIISRSQPTIRAWHAKGWLPQPVESGCHRVYTWGQIELMAELAQFMDDHFMTERPLHKSKLFKSLKQRLHKQWGT